MEVRKYFLFLKVSPVKADPSHTHSVGAVLVKYRELCPRGSEVLKSMPWELPMWKDPWKDCVCRTRHYFTNDGQIRWEICVFKSQNPPSAMTCTYQEDAWRGLRAQQLTAPLPLILRYWFFEVLWLESEISVLICISVQMISPSAQRLSHTYSNARKLKTQGRYLPDTVTGLFKKNILIHWGGA